MPLLSLADSLDPIDYGDLAILATALRDDSEGIARQLDDIVERKPLALVQAASYSRSTGNGVVSLAELVEGGFNAAPRGLKVGSLSDDDVRALKALFEASRPGMSPDEASILAATLEAVSQAPANQRVGLTRRLVGQVNAFCVKSGPMISFLAGLASVGALVVT